ncbi:hypothetical protein JK203_03565 [Gluconobacter cerinus]|uniref:hypothetical protein n=1 Tax=Gluconobacter cerinus TaxID=38307 RepID=UPI001B8C4D51|nr:hypothetical protein [Gluconobacter cerinus]MBS1039929.1 hypothetical protein [Gluconobacter cerinus]MBS1045896.1 hypothetical protein [Gluconobacter cerinus]
MFTIPNAIITYLDTFKTVHGGTVAFVASAVSLIAISKSMLNTWSLNQQANIQREIEDNRYKLELFDKRFKVFTEFKQKIFSKNGYLNAATVYELEQVLDFLGKNISEIEKLQLIFGSSDKKISSFLESTKKFKQLVLLTSAQIPLLANKKIELGDINDDPVDMNGTFAQFISTDYKRMLERQINDISEELQNNKQQLMTVPFDYDLELTRLEKYLSEKLSVPEQAFEKQPWLSVTWYRKANTFRVKCPVMFYFAVICVLFLGALLCW